MLNLTADFEDHQLSLFQFLFNCIQTNVLPLCSLIKPPPFTCFVTPPSDHCARTMSCLYRILLIPPLSPLINY